MTFVHNLARDLDWSFRVCLSSSLSSPLQPMPTTRKRGWRRLALYLAGGREMTKTCRLFFQIFTRKQNGLRDLFLLYANRISFSSKPFNYLHFSTDVGKFTSKKKKVNNLWLLYKDSRRLITYEMYTIHGTDRQQTACLTNKQYWRKQPTGARGSRD